LKIKFNADMKLTYLQLSYLLFSKHQSPNYQIDTF